MNVLDSILQGLVSASWMQLTATVLGIVGVWLTTRENLWCFPIGFVQVTLMGIVLFREQLYADTFLQAFYFGALIYGWWAWTHPETDRPQLPVTRLSLPQLGGVIAAAVIATVMCRWLLVQVGDAMPWRDAFITVFGITSQWLQARKKMEAWPGWVLVNTAGIIIFIALNMYWFVFLYFLYWILSFIGWSEWLGSYRKEAVAR